MPRIFFVLSIAAFLGCGGEDSLCAISETPSFVLGTDRSGAFVALEDEQTLALIRGPQGGCHLPLAFLTSGFDHASARIHYRVVDADNGAVHADQTTTVNLDPAVDAPKSCVAEDFRAFVEDPWDAENHRVRVQAALLDLRGRVATETVIVRVQWPEDQPDLDRAALCGPRI